MHSISFLNLLLAIQTVENVSTLVLSTYYVRAYNILSRHVVVNPIQ